MISISVNSIHHTQLKTVTDLSITFKLRVVHAQEVLECPRVDNGELTAPDLTQQDVVLSGQCVLVLLHQGVSLTEGQII